MTRSSAHCALSVGNAHPRTLPDAVGTTRHTPPAARSSARSAYVRSHAARTIPDANAWTGIDDTNTAVASAGSVGSLSVASMSAINWCKVAVSSTCARSSSRRSA